MLTEETKMETLRLIFGIFALIGMLDKVFGNRFKLGDEFERGILATGALALAMVGMMVIAPTISKILIPVLEPVSKVLHIDPSFIGAFIANDMGGASISQQLSPETVWGGYNGLIVASMLGITICFALPVPLKMIDKKYHKDVLSGILCGIATMPIGCIAGGLIVGCPFLPLLLNTSPVILVSIITCVGLVLNAELCRKIFGIIGNVILILMTIGLGAGVFAYITGIKLIPYMDSIESAFSAVVGIAILLTGVYPMIAVVSKLFKKPLTAFGKIMKINDISVVGLISTLANAIPTVSLVDKMNSKGIVMNMAFIVSTAFVFGDHLAFTMAFDESYLAGMVVGKLVSGICALIVAHFLYNHTDKSNSAENCFCEKNEDNLHV
jgi:ethanolamine transporter